MNRIVISVVSVLACSIFLHSGRTDSSGGHYNRDTGEYHYHHGYPAHEHYDMNEDGTVDCPYYFDDNTTQKNPSPSETKYDNSAEDDTKNWSNTDRALKGLNIVMIIIAIAIITILMIRRKRVL